MCTPVVSHALSTHAMWILSLILMLVNYRGCSAAVDLDVATNSTNVTSTWDNSSSHSLLEVGDPVQLFVMHIQRFTCL